MLLENKFDKQYISKESFIKTVKEISGATTYLRISLRDILLLSCAGEKADKRYKKDGYELFYILDQENVENFKNAHPLKCGYVKTSEIGTLKLIEELKDSSQLMAIIDDEKYVFNDVAVKKLCEILECGGDFVVSNSGLIRNLLLADALYSKATKTDYPRNITLAIREESGIKKVFAIFKGGAPQKRKNKKSRNQDDQDVQQLQDTCGFVANDENKQEIFEKILDELSSVVTFLYGTIRVDYTEMFLDTGIEKDGIKGLISVKTSDIGKSSLTIRAIMRYEDHDVYIAEKKLRRSRSIILDTAVETINEFIEDLRSILNPVRKAKTYSFESYKKVLRETLNAASHYIGSKNYKLAIEGVETLPDRKYRQQELIKQLYEYLSLKVNKTDMEYFKGILGEVITQEYLSA